MTIDVAAEVWLHKHVRLFVQLTLVTSGPCFRPVYDIDSLRTSLVGNLPAAALAGVASRLSHSSKKLFCSSITAAVMSGASSFNPFGGGRRASEEVEKVEGIAEKGGTHCAPTRKLSTASAVLCCRLRRLARWSDNGRTGPLPRECSQRYRSCHRRGANLRAVSNSTIPSRSRLGPSCVPGHDVSQGLAAQGTATKEGMSIEVICPGDT